MSEKLPIVYKLVAIRDVIKPNFYGCDAYDFCVKHNEFHLAVPKGGVVTVDEVQMKEILKSFETYNMWFGKENCSTGFDGMYNGNHIRLRTDDFVEVK